VESRTIAGHLAESHRGDTEAAVADIAHRAREGWRVVLVTEGKGTSKRYAEVAAEREIPVRERDDLTETPVEGMVTIVTGELRTGFVADSLRLALFTTADLSGQRPPDKSARRMPGRRKNQINPLELTPGDPVVHAQHGVGRYVEMVQRTVADATREYLLIEYAPSKRGQPGDRLYVPMDRWTRSPATWAGRTRRWTRWVGPTGPSARAGAARRSVRSRPS
jgi:transcription-repair coupling factor (superfamily II helicase)